MNHILFTNFIVIDQIQYTFHLYMVCDNLSAQNLLIQLVLVMNNFCDDHICTLYPIETILQGIYISVIVQAIIVLVGTNYLTPFS